MASVRLASQQDGEYYRALAAAHGTPLALLDPASLAAAYSRLSLALPRVKIFYAVKSLPHTAVISTLAEMGAGFDLATAGEVALVQSLGIAPQRTIHTHPIKSDAEIRAALRFGCTTFVVDNGFEIQKFARYRHRVGLLLRVGFRASNALVDLSRKYGCTPADVPPLLAQARHLGIHVKGLSFHVGSQSANAQDHAIAIAQCAEIMAADAQTALSAPMSILDIGGGFPVSYRQDASNNAIDIVDYCAPIRAALACLPEHIEVFCEPGRCLSAPALKLICSVVGKAQRGEQMWFYLDEGVYGSFSGQVYDGVRYPLTTFAGAATHPRGVLAGPTCDSIDIVAEDIPLPDLPLGAIVLAEQMGAYTLASATTFNSIPLTPVLTLEPTTVPALRQRQA